MKFTLIFTLSMIAQTVLYGQATTLFSQDFSSSTNITDYQSATPNSAPQNTFSFPAFGGQQQPAAPIVSMNFGGQTQQQQMEGDQPTEMGFQSGNRSISVPRRKRRP